MTLPIVKVREKLKDMIILRVAEKSGVPSQTLYRLMSGRNIRVDALEKISDYLEKRG